MNKMRCPFEADVPAPPDHEKVVRPDDAAKIFEVRKKHGRRDLLAGAVEQHRVMKIAAVADHQVVRAVSGRCDGPERAAGQLLRWKKEARRSEVGRRDR
jgi:hypothetical protein